MRKDAGLVGKGRVIFGDYKCVSKYPFKSFNTTSAHTPCQNSFTKKKISIPGKLDSRGSFVYIIASIPHLYAMRMHSLGRVLLFCVVVYRQSGKMKLHVRIFWETEILLVDKA